MDPVPNGLVREHIPAGGNGCGAWKKASMWDMIHILYISGGPIHSLIVDTILIPATIEGKAIHNVQNGCFGRCELLKFCTFNWKILCKVYVF